MRIRNKYLLVGEHNAINALLIGLHHRYYDSYFPPLILLLLIPLTSVGMAEEKEQNSMPPNLETFIPVDDLPDVINVHFDFNDRLPYPYPWMRFTDSHPIKFVRQLTDKGKFNIRSTTDLC